jgi:hypothetical protein
MFFTETVGEVIFFLKFLRDIILRETTGPYRNFHLSKEDQLREKTLVRPADNHGEP